MSNSRYALNLLLSSIEGVLQLLHELVVGDKVIKLVSINFEFEPEFILSGSLGLIHCVDMIRDSSLFLTEVWHIAHFWVSYG